MKRIISIVLILVCFMSIQVDAFNLYDRWTNTNITILMYHKLSENSLEWSDYCISPQEFENDIVYLKNNGFTFLKASELANADTRNKKIAVITFDDGYYSDYKYAMHILEKHKASGTFFVYGNAIGSNDYMSEKELKEMAQKDFIEIGNHSYMLHGNTYSTLNIMYRSGLNDKSIIQDYIRNATLLESITGKPVTALSYPNGLFSMQVDRMLKSMGTKITFSTQPFLYKNIDTSLPIGRKTRSVVSKIEELAK